MVDITAAVWRWQSDKGNWHFLTVTGEAADVLRFDSVGMRGGFGSIKVEAAIGETIWRTSLFPSGEDWILPLKGEVRRRAGITAGDEVHVSLALTYRDPN